MSSLNTLAPRATPVHQSPLLLLVLTGFLLGATLPVARLAGNAGWSPIAFTFAAALGSGLILLLAGRRGRRPVSAAVVKYSLVAGVLSVSVPNSLAFFVMPQLGTTMTSLAYTLPPLFTYAFGWMIGMERYRAARLAGVLLGMSGVGLLILGRPLQQGSGGIALLLALGIPLSVAAGNVYRKRHLPDGYDSKTLAGGMLLAGAAALLPLLLAEGRMPAMGEAWLLVLLQCALTSLGYFVYFLFQKVADPVYFSQLGYVMSATGVLSGVALFGERLTPWMPVAVAVIALGVMLVNRRPPQG
ncbi:DMT family transporter [Noviherbaspirillum sp.]|uniref:DMT family transporter n=1 Tax=Noviherbaspirillum sp. TaxID=1926288 RepID=UPI002D26511D|nr:DMT family transporter [Noviherbaspirillum sp.]HZW23040.1 DMT family transporter [Noviherbaspirillum sp.]